MRLFGAQRLRAAKAGRWALRDGWMQLAGAATWWSHFSAGEASTVLQLLHQGAMATTGSGSLTAAEAPRPSPNDADATSVSPGVGCARRVAATAIRRGFIQHLTIPLPLQTCAPLHSPSPYPSSARPSVIALSLPAAAAGVVASSAGAVSGPRRKQPQHGAVREACIIDSKVEPLPLLSAGYTSVAVVRRIHSSTSVASGSWIASLKSGLRCLARSSWTR